MEQSPASSEHRAAGAGPQAAAPTPAKVKVCGLTSLPDAELAVELGAWAIGMIFYSSSPRRCSLEEAQRICARLRSNPPMLGIRSDACSFVANGVA